MQAQVVVGRIICRQGELELAIHHRKTPFERQRRAVEEVAGERQSVVLCRLLLNAGPHTALLHLLINTVGGTAVTHVERGDGGTEQAAVGGGLQQLQIGLAAVPDAELVVRQLQTEIAHTEDIGVDMVGGLLAAGQNGQQGEQSTPKRHAVHGSLL